MITIFKMNVDLYRKQQFKLVYYLNKMLITFMQISIHETLSKKQYIFLAIDFLPEL